MTSEPYPEIVFEISLPIDRVIGLILEAKQNVSFLGIVQDAGNSWKIQGRDSTGQHQIHCVLSIEPKGPTCDLHFSANTEKDSDKLSLSVGLCLGVIFRGCEVLSPNMKRLAALPGLSEAYSERIATLLRSREPATITETANSLAIPEYTAAVNLRQLLKKGIIGCTPSHLVPRKYFYK